MGISAGSLSDPERGVRTRKFPRLPFRYTCVEDPDWACWSGWG
jgi:hypothetical protein